MIEVINDMLQKYKEEDLIEYLEKHARELKRGFSIVIDGEGKTENILSLYGKVEMMSSVLTAMKKRNESRAAMRES